MQIDTFINESSCYFEKFYRARFESLCGNLIQKCVALIDDVCAKSNVSSSDIEKVVV